MGHITMLIYVIRLFMVRFQFIPGILNSLELALKQVVDCRDLQATAAIPGTADTREAKRRAGPKILAPAVDRSA
jgi:hypothetical protein